MAIFNDLTIAEYDVDIPKLIIEQRRLAKKYMGDILNTLNKDELAHTVSGTGATHCQSYFRHRCYIF